MIPPTDAFETVGAGPELFLLHGTGMDRASWAPLTRLLRERLRVTCYDRRGTYGWPAPAGATPASAEEHAGDLADWLDARGGSPVHLLGASFGGVVVLELARHRPELVGRAILFEPSTDGRTETPVAVRALLGHFEHFLSRGMPERAAEAFHRRVLSEALWSRMPPAAQERARRNWRHIAGDLRATAAYRASPAEIATIKTPFLLLRGGRSSAAFEAPVRGLAKALPDARVAVIERAGHQLAGAGLPEAAEAILAFLGV